MRKYLHIKVLISFINDFVNNEDDTFSYIKYQDTLDKLALVTNQLQVLRGFSFCGWDVVSHRTLLFKRPLTDRRRSPPQTTPSS